MSTSTAEFNPQVIPELRHNLSPQFAEIGRGGQFRVHMLTDPELSQPDTPNDYYVIPRTAKIGLNSHEMGVFVRDKIGITDPAEQALKIAELTLGQVATLHTVVALAHPQSGSSLGQYMGRPALIYDYSSPKPPDGHYQTEVAYTQRYGQPVHELLSRLESNTRLRTRLGRHIIDQYIAMQPAAMRSRVFDTCYKVADNYGVSTEARLGVHDFSEYVQDYETTAQSIISRDWEKVPTQQEANKLPSDLHDYFCDRMAHFVTLKMLRDEWGKARPKHSRNDITLETMMYHDIEGTTLWNERPKAADSPIHTEIPPRVGALAYSLVLSGLLRAR